MRKSLKHHVTPRHGKHFELRTLGGLSEADALNVAERASVEHNGRSITPKEGKQIAKMQREWARRDGPSSP